jgi:hypothetical protein
MSSVGIDEKLLVRRSQTVARKTFDPRIRPGFSKIGYGLATESP